MNLLAILATITGVLVGLANFPQAMLIFKNKSARNVSIITYSIIEVSTIIWFLYGLQLKNLPFIISNILSLTMTSLVILGYLLYKDKK